MNKYEKYLGKKIKCNCGKEHFVSIRDIVVSKNALENIVDILKKNGFNNNFHVVADINTYNIAGKKILEIFNKAGIKYQTTIFNEGFLISKIENVENIIKDIQSKTSLIIAVGSGTINDLCRYAAFKKKLPYLIIATAPSMDGFASSVSPLVIDGFKKTFEAIPPVIIIGDIDILKNAPENMIKAGFGDIVGKYISLSDWKLGSLLSGEYFCDFIEFLVREALEICVQNISGLKNKEENAVENLMTALILSGIAMLMAGNSRPASGAEHHLSHFWEMYFLKEGIVSQPLHGEKVGIASIIMASFYNKFALLKKEDIEILIKNFHMRNIDSQKEQIQKSFGGIGESVINENFAGDALDINPLIIYERFDEIKNIAVQIPDSKKIESMLVNLGAPTKSEDLGIDWHLKKEGIKNCMYIRKKITILRLLDSLNLIEEYVDNL
jgi:glycerol-1-phosphate dehydrogenase [NAD(P)+]